MRDAVKTEDELAYDPLFIPIYLKEAETASGKSGDARTNAVRMLHAIYRRQISGGRADRRLTDFFSRQADRVWASRDPLQTLANLFGSPSSRDVSVNDRDRDFEICVLIAQRIWRGEDFDDIVVDLEEDRMFGGLSADQLTRIYRACDQRAVNAEVARRAIDSVGGPVPRTDSERQY
ncbi:MAG: hypothetical protein ACHP84_19190 [Caulobacterales bacterium]